MPMRYAREADVLHDLQIEPDDTATITRVVQIENALADAFTAKTGVVWISPTEPVARTFAGLHTDVMVIHQGVRDVTGITLRDTALTADDWTYTFLGDDGLAYGLYLESGYWHGPVTITGVWGDQGGDAVPDDVAHALTVLTVKEYRRMTSSPTDQIGPDGFVVSAPSGWNDPTVKEAIAAHALTRIIV
jgi:hypothetical protein